MKTLVNFVWKKRYHLLVAAVVYLAYKQRQNQKKLAEESAKVEIEQFFTPNVHIRDEKLQKRLAEAQEVYATGNFGFFNRGDGVDIAYAEFKATPDPSHNKPIPRFVIFTGWSESFIKYAEVLHDVRESLNGAVEVFMVDHRGQGLSGRTNTNSQMTHVDDFQDHVLDGLYFLEQVVHAGQTGPGERPTVVLGFSMGGLVAARLSILRPDLTSKLVLVCPCLLPALPVPPLVVQGIASVLLLLGKSQEYFPGGADAPDHRLLMPPSNVVSKSIDRIKHWEDLRKTTPETIINGMSVSHVKELVGARLESTDMEKMKVPLLLITAEKDVFVDNSRQELLASIHSNCRWLFLRDSLHEVLQEKDYIRQQAMESIIQFLREG